MMKKLLTIIIVMLAAMAITGCEKKSPPPAPEVKVTEENLDTELEKMEQEIETDTAEAEQ